MVLQEAIRQREEASMNNNIDSRSIKNSSFVTLAFNESKDMGLLKGFEEDRKKEVNELEVSMLKQVTRLGMV